jgi:TRAP-type C4-dicarboxylate transport system permease small subunit
MLLPLGEIVLRRFTNTGIPGAASFTLNLTLWVGLLGAAIAAREGKLLTLATGEFLPKGRIAEWAHVVGGFAGAAIAMMFAVGGLGLVLTERAAGDEIALGVRTWVSTLAVSRSASHSSRCGSRCVRPHTWIGRAVALAGFALGILAAYHYDFFEGRALLPWLIAILVAGALGAPIFALLGGIAMMGFFTDGSRPIVPLIKAFEELTSPSANLAAIPLFHADRFPARRRQVIGATAARVTCLVRVGTRRHSRSQRRRCARSLRCSLAAPA